MLVADPENLDRSALTHLQEERLGRLLEVLPRSGFYADRLTRNAIDLASIRTRADLALLPFTTKKDLLAELEAHPPLGRFWTEPATCYRRQHQTSGTSGEPLRWLDTEETWNALLQSWFAFFRIIGLKPSDRAFFPFSFGPFLGFWTGFEAANRFGCLTLPGGGMSTITRLRYLLENQATVVFCTPTYALRMAEVATQEGIQLKKSAVHSLIVAGEPGGNIPGTRQRIESAWNCRVHDHSGMTEIGPLSIECPVQPGALHPLESDYIVEIIDPKTLQAVSPGMEGELVVTTLHRLAGPLVRYRTGDLVCQGTEPCGCGRALIRLEGGIRGRADDMIVLRGNNFHPSSLQTIVHRFAQVAEYRVEIDRTGTLPVLRIEVEPHTAEAEAGLADQVMQAVRDELLFRAEVRTVAPGTLPRFDLKAQRIVQKYQAGSETHP